MAVFKCKASGNTVEFKQEHDVEQMRKHPDYEEVFPAAEPVKKPVVYKKPKEDKAQ